MRLINSCLIQLKCAAIFFSGFGMISAFGGESLGIVGKNDWLFLRSELSNPAEAARTAETIALIGRLNRVLVANGISMAVVMVPVKVRLYAEYLPDNVKLNAYMMGNYERMSKALQAAGVTAIDLNNPFLNSPLRASDTPLFYRLDGHWSLLGAKVASEILKTGIDANPMLKSAIDKTPEVTFQMDISKRKLPSKGIDLISLVPPNSGPFAPERISPITVTRGKGQIEANRAAIGIAVQGSSFSQDWTGFVDALRFALQRDILNVSVPAHIGSWVGMENYLSSDAFQANPPKFLIWERPEYTMRAPPDFQFQDTRYKSDNIEWLLRASAWAQATCKPSSVSAKFMSVGLLAGGANLSEGNIATGSTDDNEYIELTFNKPIQKLDYLAARFTAPGTRTLILEGSGPGEATRRFTLTLAGDDAAHALKTPLPSKSRGFTKLRIFPGKSQGFSMQGLKICRQPDDLLN
jgi:alginate O-acetyltransferase complex protein AlgJ